MLNSGCDSGDPCRTPDLIGKPFTILPLNKMSAISIYTSPLLCKDVPSMHNLLTGLSQTDLEFCKLLFLHLLR